MPDYIDRQSCLLPFSVDGENRWEQMGTDEGIKEDSKKKMRMASFPAWNTGRFC